MDAGTCPFCGRGEEHPHESTNGFTPRGNFDSRARVTSGTLDLVMNWITGMVLITVIVASVVFQAHSLRQGDFFRPT